MLSFLPPNSYRKQQTVMAIVSGLSLVGLIIWIDPDLVENILWKDSYLPFYIFFGMTWMWLLTSVSGRWKRSMLWSISITGFVWLRSHQLDTIMTVGLLILFNLVWAYYWKINNSAPASID